MTRTVFYKEVSDEQRKVYNLVRQANEAAEAIIKPGVRSVSYTHLNLQIYIRMNFCFF